jgi:predicted transcriptional regulator
MNRADRFTVRGVMTTDLSTVKRGELLDLAALVMDRRRIRQLLVVDDDDGLLGVVSYRAILRHLTDYQPGASPESVTVDAYMESDPVTVTPDTTLRDAIRTMLEAGVSVVPVVEQGRAVGVLSEHDVVRVARGLLEHASSAGPGS